MSQRQQLERIMIIDVSIRDGEYPNAERMAERIEVSRRVIFNDRDFMINRLGAPIEFDRTRGGWYYSDKTYSLPGMIVTEGELLAFFLSVEISKRFLGTSIESSLRSAVEKISTSIKGPVSVDLDTLHSHFSFSAPALISPYEQTLIDIHHAIIRKECVWMRYFSAGRGELTERKVMPYHLHNMRGDWYMIAFDTMRMEFRNFMVGRIKEWKLLDETFERDDTFSVSAWMGNAFQAFRSGEVADVVIRFKPQIAHFIRERQWHASQTIEELEDGSLILRMKTAGLFEVKLWVLKYGSGAEVLSPENLRQDCIEEIKGMNAIYENTAQ